MDIQPESQNTTSSAPAVDAAVPPTGMAEVTASAPVDPNAPATTLTQDLEKAGDYPAALPEIKPLTGMEALGSPEVAALKVTRDNMLGEKVEAKNATPKPNPIKRFFGAMGLGGGNATPAAATVVPTPDHLTTTATGTLETPVVANLNGATADGASVTKFGDATPPATETNYAGLSTPDAMAVGAANGVPFRNTIAQSGETVTAPTEVVAGATPTLGSETPKIEEATPLDTVGETATEPTAEVVAPPAVPAAAEPEAAAVFQPSADVAPAEEESVLPDASASTIDSPVAAMPVQGLEDPNQTVEAPIEEPEATPAVETETEERSVEEPASLGQSADANSEPVQAGPGASPDGTVAATDWSVNADVHPDAPIVPGHEDALVKAMADGAAAAADKPPFTTDALNGGAGTQQTDEQVGHNVPIEIRPTEVVPNTASEAPETETDAGEIADAPLATLDASTEPTAPATAVPGGASPTNPSTPTPIREGVDVVAATGAGMVNDAASLNAGLPNAEAQSVFEVVPNSSEVNNVTAFPGTNTQPTTPELASNDSSLVNATVETPANVTAFPAAAPLAPTGTDGTTQTS